MPRPVYVENYDPATEKYPLTGFTLGSAVRLLFWPAMLMAVAGMAFSGGYLAAQPTPTPTPSATATPGIIRAVPWTLTPSLTWTPRPPSATLPPPTGTFTATLTPPAVVTATPILATWTPLPTLTPSSTKRKK